MPTGIKVVCQNCGKEIITTPYKIKIGQSKFCSRSCASIVCNTQRKSKVIIQKCKVCGKPIKTTPAAITKGQGKYCSRKCGGMAHSLHMKGNNNPSWKGGIVPEVMALRNSKKSQDWRQQVFIRDEFKCCECGQIGGKLEAHHIKRFSDILLDIKHNLPLLSVFEAAMLYKPLWDISNGVTLCKKCHSKKRRR